MPHPEAPHYMPSVSVSQTQRPEADRLKKQPSFRKALPGFKSGRSRYVASLSLLLGITPFATIIGTGAMADFRAGQPPFTTIIGLLPYRWDWSHLELFASGLPFALTLLCILLADELSRYFACRYFGISPSLPLQLQYAGASLKMSSRSTLIATNAAGPIAAFAVALGTASYGLLHSPTISTRAAQPFIQFSEPSIFDLLRSTMLASFPDIPPIPHLLPHPVLVASWIGLLIIAAKLLPAGHTNGGNIVYAISPRLHQATSSLTIALLLYLGTVEWVGWLVAAALLITSAKRNPVHSESEPIGLEWLAMAPICFAIFVLTLTTQPIVGMNLVQVLLRMH